MVQNRAMNKAFGEPETQVRESMAHRVDSVVEELLSYMFFNDENQARLRRSKGPPASPRSFKSWDRKIPKAALCAIST